MAKHIKKWKINKKLKTINVFANCFPGDTNVMKH